MRLSHLLLASSLAVVQASRLLHADTVRDQRFDSNWRFLREDATGAQDSGFDDSSWRIIDVPHDWSIEDLPERKDAFPALDAVTGEWVFHPGDNAEWKSEKVDESDWQKVMLPDTWEHHSNYTDDNVYGWFRRRIKIPDHCKGKDFELLMGRIDDVDEVWLNGQRIGGMGSFPPNYNSAWDVERRYHVPAALIRGDGTDVLAVRVYDGPNSGGIYAAGVKSDRIGPFDTRESAGADRTGYTVGGTGWYRKHFTLNAPNKHVVVRFDGVYMDADVWINGKWLGNHPYGYTSFEYDITPHLNSGPNVFAVRVRNEGKNSRWYSGSGIYRHVWLTVTEPIYVPTWGVFVTTPQVTKSKATLKISTEVSNASDSDANVVVHARVVDSSGASMDVGKESVRVAASDKGVSEQSIELPNPKLWSTESPNLYCAIVDVSIAGKTVDTVSTNFGIRKIEVDAEHGFRLNDESIKLKGGCIHHDNGPLGAAAIDRAEERKVELMKANGFNAIRTSHNPPSPALLDACDRLGMLVLDEAFDQWNEQKTSQDYHRFFKDWYAKDIASMVRRDRNHPSIIMWSIGNEIPEQFRGEATARALREAVQSHDSTRPITAAICSDWGNVIKNWDTLSDPAFAHLDVCGYNYLPDKYESDHARHLERIMMGTESYPQNCFDYWSIVEKHPYVIGDFVWTAVDYLGESGIGHSTPSNEQFTFFMSWPWHNAWCGDLDICGFKKPQSFYRDVVWRRSPLEMMVHSPMPAGVTDRVSGWGWPNESQSWNWAGHEGVPLKVSVYSRCEAVRLELNGKVVGETHISTEAKLKAEFDVPYGPGELRALGLNNGKVVAEKSFSTSGSPKKLKLTADRAALRTDRNDLSYVTIAVVDDSGRRVADAGIPVKFSLSGAGELAGVGNGVPNDPSSFRLPQCKTFQGRCLAILRPYGTAGEIILRAEADGLEPATIVVRVQ